MTTSTTTRQPINGVDVPRLFATLDAVREQPAAGRFQFRVDNRWIGGAHSRSTIHEFFGAGAEQRHVRVFTSDADHPEVLVGDGEAPSPAEHLLHALASCLTAGIGNIASARGIELSAVESHLEGDIDVRGVLGLSDEVRNGFERIRVSFRIRGDAAADELRAVVEQARDRSAVLDMLTNGVPVELEVSTE